MEMLPDFSVSIEDRLLNQDRWIIFLISLGMLAVTITVIELKNIDREYEQRITEINENQISDHVIMQP